MLKLHRVAGDGSSARGAVVFVHGLDGDYRATWSHDGSDAGFWPAWLGQDFPNLDVYALGYPAAASRWRGSAMALPDRAANLLAELVGERLDGKPLIFVCHSLGGLVVKQALRAAASDSRASYNLIADRTRGVVFIATPHAGSLLATFLDGLSLAGATAAIKDLRAHSPYLRDLGAWYRDWVTNRNVLHLVFCEQQRTYKLFRVVNSSSADPGISGVRPIPLDADHVSICKAPDRASTLYKSISRTLKDWMPSLPSAANPGPPLSMVPAEPPRFRAGAEHLFAIYVGSVDRPAPFGGRADLLRRLDAWLHDTGAPRRLLLWGYAGRGKTAVLIRWLEGLGPHHHVVFLPISIRAGTNREELLYHALAAGLAPVMGERLRPPASDPVTHYKDLTIDWLRRVGEFSRPVLLVVDGLDETAGWTFDHALLPFDPPPQLKVLLSARVLAGDQGPNGWLERLGWRTGGPPPAEVEVVALGTAGIVDVLRSVGEPVASLAAAAAVPRELERLTGGDPLLVGLYVEDLRARGVSASGLMPEDLAGLAPGFGAYLGHWLRNQEAAWFDTGAPFDRDAVDSILALLACALAPLDHSSLAELHRRLRGPSRTLPTRALAPLSRLVVGDGRRQGYALCHPKLGQHLRDEPFLDPALVRAAGHTFLSWGQDTLRGLQDRKLLAKDTPEYLLLYYRQHLELAAAPAEQFLDLVCDGWRLAWAGHESRHHGFAGDVRAAFDRIGRAQCGDPGLQEVLRRRVLCTLCLASVRSVGSEAPPHLLALAVEEGILSVPQVLETLEIKEAEKRPQILAAIAGHLPDEGWPSMLEEVKAIPDPAARAYTLVTAAECSPEERRDTLVRLARLTVDVVAEPSNRIDLLIRLAPLFDHAARRENFATARAMVEKVDDAVQKARFLRQLAKVAEERNRDGAVALAVEAADALPDNLAKVNALVELAPLLSPPAAEHRLTLAEEVAVASYEEAIRRRSENANIPRFTEGMARGKLHALQLLRAARDPGTDLAAVMETVLSEIGQELDTVRVGSLLDVAPSIPSDHRPWFMAKCRELANSLPAGNNRMHALLRLAAFRSEETTDVVREALANAELIRDERFRVEAMVALAAVLPPQRRAEETQAAYAAVLATGYASEIARGLVKFAVLFQASAREALLRTAYEITRNTGDHLPFSMVVSEQTNLLQNVPVQLQDLRREIFTTAFDTILRFRQPTTSNMEHQLAILMAFLAQASEGHWDGVRLDEALEIAAATEWAHARNELWVSLAPIAHRLGRRDVVHRALEAVQAAEDTEDLVRGLATLAPLFDAGHQDELLKTADHEAYRISDVRKRLRALSTLVPVLPHDAREGAAREAVAACRVLPPNERAAGLIAVADQVAPERRSEILCDAFSSARAIAADGTRAVTLAQLATRMPEPQERLEALEAMLEAGSRASRPTLFVALAASAPALHEFEGDDGVKACIRDVAMVTAWWP